MSEYTDIHVHTEADKLASDLATKGPDRGAL